MRHFFSIILALSISFSTFSQRKLNLEDIFENYYYYHSTLYDEAEITGDKIHAGIFIIPFESTNGQIPYEQIKSLRINPPHYNIIVNSQGTHVIYSKDWKPFRRYSSIGSYQIIFDTTQDDSLNLNRENDVDNVTTVDKPLFTDENMQIINPVFSPDGEKICFVHNNNLYYSGLDGTLVQITEDGKEGIIRNGSPNLVYEEEFDMTTAYWWSPDSKKICFLEFYEEGINNQPLPLFDSTTILREQKYSFAGSQNAHVEAYVYDLEKETVIKHLRAPDELFGSDFDYNEGYYISSVTWLNNTDVAISYINRRQNKEIIYLQTTKPDGKDFQLFVKDDYNSYINPSHVISSPNFDMHIIWSADNPKEFYVEHISGNAVEAYSYNDENMQITDCYGFFPKDSTLRLQVVGQMPRDRQVIAININTFVRTNLSEATGWNEAKFSEDGKFMLLHHSEISITGESEYTKSVKIETGAITTQWTQYEEYTADSFPYSEMKFAPVEWITIPTEDDSLYAYIIKPELKKRQKCPVYVTTYGGPTGQSVTNEYTYNIFWYQYLVQQGYAVVVVDPRGTESRSVEFTKQTYKHLGEKESYDMHIVAEYLKQQTFVDSCKLAIEGWSFGGYLSLLTAAKYPNDYKAVISVAPVADWHLYDNIYTEKYMGLPEENTEGYQMSSVIPYLKNLEASVLLAYGTADDNVRNINGMKIIRTCIDERKDIQTLVFPNDNHDLYGKHSRIYLMTNMYNFLESKLK